MTPYKKITNTFVTAFSLDVIIGGIDWVILISFCVDFSIGQTYINVENITIGKTESKGEINMIGK